MTDLERFYVYEREEFAQLANGSFPLCVYSVSGKRTLAPMHSHRFFELAIVTAGEGSYCDNEHAYHVKAGDVLLLRPGMAHEYRVQNSLAVSNILWIEDDLRLPMYDLKMMPGWNALFEIEPRMRSRVEFQPLNLEGEELAEAERLVRHMESELKSGEPGAHLMASGLFSQLLVFLCRCYARAATPRARELQGMDRVLLYMNRQFREQIPRAKLASLVAMSESSFYRSFKRIIGLTPTEYLNTVRLRNAEQLLRTTSNQVADIAFECGFYDSSYFCACFKRSYGLPPHRYRAEHGV